MIKKEIVDSEEFVTIFGIRFLKKGYPSVRAHLMRGGLMIAPSAPSLALISDDKNYHESLQASDFAIPDSGLMALVLKHLFHIPLQRLSGLEFLQCWLQERARTGDRELFLVEPSVADHEANVEYLRGIGVTVKTSNHYIAPIYGGSVVRDFELLERVEAANPDVVLINLGGGVQELVGHFLRTHLSYKPAIICTGAAIAFLSGRQVEIPSWADRLFLGWLFRCCSNPRKYVPRYFYSIRLITMLLGSAVKKHYSAEMRPGKAG